MSDPSAERLGKSRSEVDREAVPDRVARREQEAVTHALDELADELAAEDGSFAAEAAPDARTQRMVISQGGVCRTANLPGWSR